MLVWGTGPVKPPRVGAVGAGSIVALVLFRRFYPRFPAPLLVVAAATLAVYAFGLEGRGVGIVGQVPGGLPGLSLPDLDPGPVVALIPTALTIAFVGFMEFIAVAPSLVRTPTTEAGPQAETGMFDLIAGRR